MTRRDRERELQQRLRLNRERIRLSRARATAGEVRVSTEPHDEHLTLEATVLTDALVVERRQVWPRPAEGPLDERTFRIRLGGDVVCIRQEPVVTEEITVSRYPTDRTERITTTERREEPVVRATDEALVRDETAHARKER